MNDLTAAKTFIQADEGLCVGTFLIGDPAEQHHRVPVRKPVEVTWR